MRKSVQRIRGVDDIQTHAGKVDMVAIPYRAYMRIAALEMEKNRRLNERETAMHRVNNIDNRVKEIEQEQKSLLKALTNCNGESRGTKQSAPTNKEYTVFNENETNTNQGKGIKLRY